MTNKEAISKVLIYILDTKNGFPKNIINRIFNELLWSATEDNESYKKNKYKIKYWSPKAIENYNNKGISGLIHEHVYPKKLIKKEILHKQDINHNQISQKQILNILNKSSIAAIITKDEHQILNKTGFRNSTLRKEKFFSRYIETGIELKRVRFEGKKIIEEGFILQNKKGQMILIENKLH